MTTTETAGTASSATLTAWVPARAGLGMDDAAALAADWARKAAVDAGIPPTVVTDQLDALDAQPALAQLAREGQRVVQRNNPPRRPGAPVLAFRTLPVAFAMALQHAAGAPLVVVEAHDHLVTGWAAETSALDLTTGRHADPLPGAVRDELEAVRFYGNNGYASTPGRDRVKPHLAELKKMGVQVGVVTGFLLAHEKDGWSVLDLVKLWDKLGPVG